MGLRNDIKSMTSNGAVVWALDPFEDETRPSLPLVQRLMRLLEESSLKLQPVYVLSIPESGGDFHFKEDVAFRVRLAEEATAQYLKFLKVTNALPVKVMVDTEVSRKRAIQKVVDFSEQIDAKCILVSSHGRAGANRFFFGSFSESLLSQSPKPVLFLTHLRDDVDSTAPIHRVLFPTDFSEPSHQAFQNFLDEIEGMGLEVTLFHTTFFPVVVTTGWGAETVLPKNFMLEQEAWAQKEGARWIEEARLSSTRVRLVIQEDGFGTHVADAILKAADQEEAHLIAMASNSGPISALVVGSVAREVFRANRYPVWVYGPTAIDTFVEPPRHYQEPPTAAL